MHRQLPDDSKGEVFNYETTMGQKYLRMIGLFIHHSQGGKGSFCEAIGHGNLQCSREHDNDNDHSTV